MELVTMEGRAMKRIVAAAALAAAFWAIKRWLDHRYLRIASVTRDATENWENEGGALAPRPAGLETSQAAR